ncbi:MAG: YtxH domain-containing protein [Anaerolineaceae bacterium]|nr:YtxH domain-containing protein [Anaerolineaceae bacterium]
MKKFGYFSLGAFIGALISGILVLLFTPVSGKQLQNDISYKIQETIDAIKEASELRQEELKSELEILRQGKTIKIESVE